MRTHALTNVRYKNREEAGNRLAEALTGHRAERPVVLGIPRGGVPVAKAVARRLGGELDIVVARKLGAPGQEELAIGAVTANGGRFLNEDIISELGVAPEYLENVTAAQRREAKAREERFRGARSAIDLKGRVAIVVDDGLATGATMRAALRSVRAHHPARLVAAIPVASRDACEALKAEADEVVCPEIPDFFYAVGAHYVDFRPVEDEEVLSLLREA